MLGALVVMGIGFACAAVGMFIIHGPDNRRDTRGWESDDD